MKFHLVVASLVAVVATSSLMSMENEKARLNFIVNDDQEITGYSKQNMKLLGELVGKRITRMFPFKNKDFHSFQCGFARASEADETNEPVKVPYTLDQKNFVAKITALKTAEQDILAYNYFVKLQEKANIGANYTDESLEGHFNLFVGHTKKRLNFLVDNDQCITGWSRENMKFAIKPSEFVGKNIIDVLPLSPEDRKAALLGFCRAVEKKETVKVPYTLETMDFVATITALKTERHAMYIYFVKVQEAKK